MLIDRLICLIMFVIMSYFLKEIVQETRNEYMFWKRKQKKIVPFIITGIVLFLGVAWGGVLWIKEIPKTINGELSVERGNVEECSIRGDQRYDLILRYGREVYELENVCSDPLQEGDYVKIAIGPTGIYRDIVQEINGKTTDYYSEFYGTPWLDKLWIGIYIFINIVFQLRLWKKECNQTGTGIEKWLGNIWLYGLLAYSGVLLISYIDIFDNDVLGIVVCMLFIIYSFAEALYLLCATRKEMRNSDTQTSAVYGEETQGEKGKETMTEEEKKRIAKRNWIRLIVAFTVMAVIITVVNYFMALESRRWIVLVFYPAVYVIGMAAIVYGMKHQKKKEEDGKKEND